MLKNTTIRILNCMAVVSGCFSSAYAGYGDPQDTLPSAFEREVHVMTNAVRMDPRGFRDAYISGTTILSETAYPSVAPLVYNQSLSAAARSHSVDMALNCGMQHESCDGTSFSKRVASFYKGSSGIAENVATGKSTGLQTVIQWLRDDVEGKPAADKSAYDGHRRNIMNASYKELGVGYAYSASKRWNHFWTQDFGAGKASLYKIPAGCHFKQNSSSLSFAANYYDPDGMAPKSAVVVIDSKVNQMELLLGNPSKGTYSFSITDDKKEHCYRFIFTDAAGTEIHFPEAVTLTTGKELSCSSTSVRACSDRFSSFSGKRNNPGISFFTLNGVRICGKLVMYRFASGMLVSNTLNDMVKKNNKKVTVK
ncbi:MAG: CAP domain-containing protein [Chitinispirillaceae bacterium]|nr:CAP domain-containing protein [Chitinispirillaceae bacterium]